MFCFQCQETAHNAACTSVGTCGKSEDTARLQDQLLLVLRGLAMYGERLQELGVWEPEGDKSMVDFVVQGLFSTVTNANWDNGYFRVAIKESLERRDGLRRRFLRAYGEKHGHDFDDKLPELATWAADEIAAWAKRMASADVPRHGEEADARSLRELLIFGVKGIAAYVHHAAVLGFRTREIDDFIIRALAATTKDLGIDEMVEQVMKAGEMAVAAMALLDEANTASFGNPEMTEVNIGVGTRPGILISGHDLKDIGELLDQTEGTGIDVYTHTEMLPAHCYPAFKRYDHLVGNYGGAWWRQTREFESFNGPILLTSNCLTPLKKQSTYPDRLFTTGTVGYEGAVHIPDPPAGGRKDFSALIAKAKTCASPTELETGTIVAGFAHHQVMALADQVVEAVKSGAVRRFVVMAGCDGQHWARHYYTEVAEKLPKDTIILTAGCAKYRYNKLDLGDIGGIPRVLDAGQCNDSYSLAVVALKLKEVFGAKDVNDLPISYDIAWYEQKAVAVLLALLSLGVKGIRLGPTLPAFLSPNVLKLLIEKFDIKPIDTVEGDIRAMMAGK
uniref:Hydroxylamine reductase n=1 Tax=Candidatus Kentrum sp. MB TaxID=2138164 RepID=A0A450X7Q2_9GAMM|nr:MAG: hydroxylamine reductase [Candidatus Kentron sp. MB]VFK33458.1 MAG: hydroxylamine reductase [Candidatus Kentron sp. MB]VFK76222.1 MAG: hydroxylamine reductase [Candidatus Kentron sp. MB]